MLKSFASLCRNRPQLVSPVYLKPLCFNQTPINNFASFQDKVEKRQKSMSEQEFKKEIDVMVNKPTFTLVDYKQRVIDGLTQLKKGIKAKLMSGNEATEASLMTHKKILNAMHERELIDEKLVKGPVKKDIAAVSQTTVEEINSMLKNFDQLKNIHSWLKKTKENGEPLPANQEEMITRFRRDKPVTKSFLKFQYKRQTFSKRMMRQRMKWGPRKKL